MREPASPHTLDSGWDRAVRLCEFLQTRMEKADTLLNRFCISLSTAERRRCQSLFFGVLRNRRLLRAAYEPYVRKDSRALFHACCEVALFEVLDSGDEQTPKIIHYTIDWAKQRLSRAEARALNAILRRACTQLALLADSAPAAIRLSHPDWLAHRWQQRYGESAAEQLMQWNQQPPPVFGRWRGSAPPPEYLEATSWHGFYRIPGRHWKHLATALKQGELFVQDPSTRLAVCALGVQPGESVLDLCASPGGKSLLIADALGENTDGQLVCVEKSADRISLLDENLSKLNTGSGPRLQLLHADILDIERDELGHFDAVLLDAPCSNTGVLRRRPDLRWRLQPESAAEAAELQLKLLCKAADWVRAGGRMAYSTCSIEPEENEGVVDHFLRSRSDFSLSRKVMSVPHESGHDGAGVHLIQRSQPGTVDLRLAVKGDSVHR